MKYDEDMAYELYRQKRIDRDFIDPTKDNTPLSILKVKIGSANIHRPQRYAHKDPAPWLQFPDENNTVDWEAIVYAGIGSILVVLIAGLMFYCAS